MFNKLLAGLLIYVMAVSQVVAQTAALVPNAKQTFLGTTGAPLAAGTVTMYVPNSTNKKTTWVDPNQASSNTNPIVLDAAGRGVIFGQGNYRQVVKDKNGVQIWDSFTSAPGSAAPSGATGTDTAPIGAVMPWASFSVPTNWLLAYGQNITRADYPELLAALTIVNTAVSCTNGSPTLTGFASTAQFRVGAPVEASCISTGVTIATIAGPTSITVSANASATVTITATVFPWGNGNGTTTFNIPDIRGRVMPGADAMGGTAASRLTTPFYGSSPSPPSVSGGAQSNTLAQNNLPNFSPTFTGTPISPSLSGPNIIDASSTVQVSTGGAAQLAGVSSVASTWTVPFTPGGTINSINGGVTQQPFATIQPSITINYIIKAKPNTTGAGGVVSLGGMFGDIICDSTFNCSPQGSPAVNTIGLASQSNITMLANVSGGPAQPTPITNTQWLDTACGSVQGSIMYRAGSVWDCLGPGISDQALVTKGSGANPQWQATSGLGTVTSVGLDAPSEFSVSGSPVDSSGNLTFAWANPTTVPHGGTGVDTFTANSPLIGNGTSPITQGTRSGNTTSFATTSGSLTSGNCIRSDASGNLVDAGGACSSSLVFNVKDYGAVGNGSTNDTTSIQNAINAAAVLGGTVWFPAGNYCVYAGITVSGSLAIDLVGATQSAVINACATDVAVVTMTGTRHIIRNISVVGKNSSSLSVGSNAITIAAGCVGCMIDRVYAALGYYAVNNLGVDTTITDSYINSSFGPAAFHTANIGLWVRRTQFDQNWPTGVVPSIGTSFSAWTASTSFSANVVVTANGFYWQCVQSGTSTGSGSGPSPTNGYNTQVTDGSAKWLLVGPASTYYGVHLDGGTAEAFFDETDVTGSYTNNIRIDNNNGVGAPYVIGISKTVIGAGIGGAIVATAGNNLTVTNTEAVGCISSGCSAIAFQSSWAGNARIIGNTIFNAYFGILLGVGTNNIISGNAIGAQTTGTVIAAGVSYFNLTNNSGSAFGGNNNVVVNVGASDHYVITGNIAGTVTDGGTGTNKTVSGNW